MNSAHKRTTLPGCPCRGCGERQEACHSSCEAYAEWKAENDAVREARTQENLLGGYAVEACERVRKGTHQAFVRRRAR